MKIIRYYHEGTANEGLYIAVTDGETTWRGYLEKVEEENDD